MRIGPTDRCIAGVITGTDREIQDLTAATPAVKGQRLHDIEITLGVPQFAKNAGRGTPA